MISRVLTVTMTTSSVSASCLVPCAAAGLTTSGCVDNHLVCVPPSYLDDVPGITAKVAVDAATATFGCDAGEGHLFFGTRVQVRSVVVVVPLPYCSVA